jgi:hypothetical protein
VKKGQKAAPKRKSPQDDSLATLATLGITKDESSTYQRRSGRREAREVERETPDMARPVKLDAARIGKLVSALQAGNTRRSAAIFAGVNVRTVERRVARDPSFRDLLRDAEERAVIRNVALIQTAAKTSWQAAAWWLERRFPADWGRHLTVAGTGMNGAISLDGVAPTIIVLPDNGREPTRGRPRRLLRPLSFGNGNGNGAA